MIFGWGKGQAGSAAEQVALLGRELALESLGLDNLLTLTGRHGAQIADGGLQLLSALRRDALKLRIELSRLLLLVRSQVLPGLHALQNPVLLLRWETIKMLQSIAQSLLALGWKIAELGIIIQRLLLLIRRQASVAAEPLPGMIALLGLLPRGLPFFPLLDALEAARLSRTRQNDERQHEAGERRRHFRRDWFEV